MSEPAERGPSEELRARIEALLDARDGRIVGLEEIAPGLGARRFFRVHLDGPGPRTWIARVEPDSPADDAVPEPLLSPLLAFLAHAGVPVPAVRAQEPGDALVLLEDCGDRSLECVAGSAEPGECATHYGAACALIPRLQRIAPPTSSETGAEAIEAFERHLDLPLIASKARKFTHWALPALLGRDPTDDERATVEGAFRDVAEEATAAPQRLAHRDYKAANLHQRPGGSAADAWVMIDLQGAFLAPPEYDLVCLLRDSHVQLPEDLVRQLAERTRADLPDAPDTEAFWRRFDLLTLVRVAKDISHYIHAAHARGDDRYLRFVATGLANLRRAGDRSADRDPRYGPIAALLHELPIELPPGFMAASVERP